MKSSSTFQTIVGDIRIFKDNFTVDPKKKEIKESDPEEQGRTSPVGSGGKKGQEKVGRRKRDQLDLTTLVF